MGKGLPSSEEVGEDPWVMISIRGTDEPEKGPAAVSDSEGAGGSIISPRLLLLPSHCEPSRTTRTLADAWCRIPLSAINTKSFPVAEKGDSL